MDNIGIIESKYRSCASLAIQCLKEASIAEREDAFKHHMKDHSTMTIFEFLLSIAWKDVIGFIWYKNLLFRVLPQRDVYDSLQLLLIMMLISAVCFTVVMNRRKMAGLLQRVLLFRLAFIQC